MSGSRRAPRRLGAWGCLLCGAAWAWACGPGARADDDHALKEGRAQEAGPRQDSRVSRIDLGAQFEQAMRQFLHGGGSPDGGASPFTAMLVSLRAIGESRLAMIDAACGLSADQRQRLQLAVDSDVRRLADEFAAARAKYRGRVMEFDQRDLSAQVQMREFHQDMQRLGLRRRSLLGADSLLAKALPTTLDGDQRTRLAAEIDGRRSRRWRRIVASFLDGIDASLGLDQRQYDVVERLLLERLPPLQLDMTAVGGNPHHAEHLVAWSTLAAVDEGRLRATLNERQWRALAPWREKGRNVRANIESLGILEQVPE